MILKEFSKEVKYLFKVCYEMKIRANVNSSGPAFMVPEGAVQSSKEGRQPRALLSCSACETHR